MWRLNWLALEKTQFLNFWKVELFIVIHFVFLPCKQFYDYFTLVTCVFSPVYFVDIVLLSMKMKIARNKSKRKFIIGIAHTLAYLHTNLRMAKWTNTQKNTNFSIHEEEKKSNWSFWEKNLIDIFEQSSHQICTHINVNMHEMNGERRVRCFAFFFFI